MLASTRKGVALWVLSVLFLIFAGVGAEQVHLIFDAEHLQEWVMLAVSVLAIALSIFGAVRFSRQSAG